MGLVSHPKDGEIPGQRPKEHTHIVQSVVNVLTA